MVADSDKEATIRPLSPIKLFDITTTMAFLRCALYLTALSIIAMRNVAVAQDEFGQVLLEAFTTGMFNGESSEQTQTGPMPTQTPAANAFPVVTLQPALLEATSEVGMETPDESPEQSLEYVMGASPDASPEASLGVIPDESPEGSSEASLGPIPEESSEHIVDGSPEETTEPVQTSPEPSSEIIEPSPTAIIPISEDDAFESPTETLAEDFDGFSTDEEGSISGILTVYEPIRVNCGSFDDRNTFSKDTNPWFSKDSTAVEDPFAAAQFQQNSEALLYSSYRYSAHDLTYTVPVPTTGVWRVTLQWSEIVPVFMKEGARVFSVS